MGLPLQSLHNGRELVHEPLRLNVIIEAPTSQIDGIIDAHPAVRDLVDNGWLHLLAIGEGGEAWRRDTGQKGWVPAGTSLGNLSEQSW